MLRIARMDHVLQTSHNITPRRTAPLPEVLSETSSIHLPSIVALRTWVTNGVRLWIARIWFARKDVLKETFLMSFSHPCHPGTMESVTRRRPIAHYPASVDLHLRPTLSFLCGPRAFMHTSFSHLIQILSVEGRFSHRTVHP